MSTVVKMRTFPVTSEIFSSLPTRGSKTSLPIPRSTKSSALLEMLGIFVCFAAALFLTVQLYGSALCLLDSRLPKAFGVIFCAAYVFQLFIGYLEHKEEQEWRKARRNRGREI